MQADTFEEMIKRARDEQLQNYQGKATKDNNTQIIEFIPLFVILDAKIV